MSSSRCTSFVTASVVGLSALPALAQNADVTRKLDSIAGAAVARRVAVGTVAAVVRGNDTLLLKGYGKADLEWDVPMPVDAMFEMGSVAKQFTAAAILKLRDDGKLTLEDNLTKWLPDFDTRGNTVTLRHLLNHTSGVHDLTETPEFRSLVSNRYFPRDSGTALIRRYPFDFPTGSMQLYSNSGFWLLGLVVEKASGSSYEDYVEKHLLAPLGMTRSTVCNGYENIPRRAHGYGIQGDMVGRAPTSIQTWFFGGGAICSTAGDMVTWLKALHGGRVLSPKSYTEMTTASKLNDWATLRYGLGVGVGPDANGIHSFEHGGIVAGFRTQATWYPESQMAVVVLVNNTGPFDPQGMAEELAAAALGRTRPALRPYTGDPAPFVGRYKGRGTNGDLTIEVTAGAQGPMVSANGSPPRPISWVDGTTFRFNAITLTFNRTGTSGPMTELGFNPAKGFYSIFKRQ